jgi:1-acyl-sn-glycerol-3-phosphate acyltransferase
MQQRMTFWYLLAKTFFNYRVIGAENMIEEGPCIIAANHCSYLDPPLVGIACKRAIHYLARKTLLDVPILGPILPELNVIPVDQKNAERSALMGAIRVVGNGGAVLIFPEGTRSPSGQLQAARPGIGMISAKTGAPVVPIWICGSHEIMPRDSKWPRRGPVTVTVGEPVMLSCKTTVTERETYQLISDRVMETITRLRDRGRLK